MKLGFDLDEVVVDLTTEIEKYLGLNYGIDWYKEYATNYDISDAVYHQDEVLNRKIIDDLKVAINDPEFQFNSEPVEGACEALNRLKRLGHKIHFISSRPKQNQSTTFKWLRKYDIPFDSVDVIGHSENKGLYGRKYDLDMYVDDLESHLLSMLAYKKRWRKGLILFDKPWNSAYHDGSKFVRLTDWQEILRHVGIQNR